MAASEAHKDEVRNRVLSQRIKRLIQTGQYTPLKQENLEPVIKAKPLLLLKETEEPKGKNPNPTLLLPRLHFYPFLVSRKKFENGHDLADFGEMFFLTDRKEKSKENSISTKDDSKERRENNKLGSCASGIDLSEQIISRKVCFEPKMYHV